MLNKFLKQKEHWKKITKIIKRVLFISVLAIIGNNVGYMVYNDIQSKKEAEQVQQRIWEGSAEQSKSKSNGQKNQKIDIIFNENPKALSKEQHKFIEETVNKIAEGIDSPDELLGLSVEQGKIQTIVSSDANDKFVDNEHEENSGASGEGGDSLKTGNQSQKPLEHHQFLTNAGSLYMDNAYIGLFVGTDGTFGNIIATVGSDNIVRIYSRQAFVNTENSLPEIENETEQTSGNEVTENQYKLDIYNIISAVYSGADINDKQMSIKRYFTEDGENTLLNQASKVNKSMESIELGYIEFAKSSLEDKNMNKIYLQLETTDKTGTKGYIDLELKLNENNIVYDIDIL